MKKYCFVVLALLTIVATSFTTKDKGSSDKVTKSQYENPKYVNLRQSGESVRYGDYNFHNIKPKGSANTLLSLKSVPPLPLYFMDYMAEVDWDQLTAIKYGLYDTLTITKRIDSLLYYCPPVKPNEEDEARNKGGACSGFVCFNSNNELLFCRNYDGNTNPLVVVFNKNVKSGEHKSVMMTDLKMAQMFSGLGEEYGKDSCLTIPRKPLDAILRQPMAIMDGMNDAGLCIAAYQLPDFEEKKLTGNDAPDGAILRPYGINQDEKGKAHITSAFLHEMILAKCATVQDVVNLFNSYNYTTTVPKLNIHWYVADAQNNWATLEFWKGPDGKDSLYVMNEKYRADAAYLSRTPVPYEYRCIENFYCNMEAASAYNSSSWQYTYSTKARALNMMSHYSPVMEEDEALRCLQYGSYGIEAPGYVTDWSCVYNPKNRTVKFTMRNNEDIIYLIDLNKDLE